MKALDRRDLLKGAGVAAASASHGSRMIRLPEICADLCFGGEKRNRLFMTASQSLYSLYLAVQGAHIC